MLMCSVDLWGVDPCKAGQELTVGGMLDAVAHRGKGCCGLRRATEGFQWQSGLGGFLRDRSGSSYEGCTRGDSDR